MDELISEIPKNPQDTPRALARDLCTLAGWYHLLRDREKYDVALRLAAELLDEAEGRHLTQNWA